MNQDALQIGLDQVMPAVRASGLLVSLATFRQPIGATTEDPGGNLDDSGFPDYEYEDVDGLTDIPCMMASTQNDGNKVAADEMKGLEESQLNAPKIIVLDDRYPSAEQGWRNGWRISVDGTEYDLMGVEGDSQSQYTHCYARLLTQ